MKIILHNFCLFALLLAVQTIKAQESDTNSKVLIGIVTDDYTGDPLPGTNIYVKGTTHGTVTDMDGNYSLDLSNYTDPVIIFSYTGYITEEVQPGNQQVLNISLSMNITSLGEVQVVGYGVQRKRSVTGSISSVDAETLSRSSSTGLDQALQGKSAGVFVSQNSNAPGGGVSIRIRGIHSTTGGNEPLYVVDGVPVNSSSDFVSVVSGGQGGSPLNVINPEDIESIEILKDASAAAIYGTRAAAGVVLITTKKGKKGEPQVLFNSYYGVQNVTKRIDLTNAENFAILDNEMRANAKKPLNTQLLNPVQLGEGTNWQNQIYTEGVVQNYNLSVSGGNERSTYMLSGNYHQNNGVVSNSGFQRYTFRINTSNELKDWLKIGNNFTYTNTGEDFVITDSDTWGAISNALRQMPTVPVFLDNGKYGGMADVFDYTVRNPVAIVDEWKQDIVKDYVLGDLNLEINPVENLTYRSVLGLEYRAGSQSFFQPANIGGGLVDEINIKKEYRNTSQKLLYDNILTYANQFGDIHNYSVMIGTSFQQWEGNAVNAQGQEFPNNDPDWDLSMSTNGTRNAGGSTWRGAYVSQFGRITYDYDNKYLLTANIRRDGSTKFGSENRYGIFPSFSVGWIFTDEAFMARVREILTVGKLRFGYGVVGSDAIGNFRYLSLLKGFEYTLNGQTARGFAPQSLENPAIRWESSEQFSLGADLSFLFDKITLILDYYEKNTTGMLIPMPVPATSGIYPKVPSNQNQLAQAFPIVNVGGVKNTGFEMELTYRKSEGVFHYEVGANFAYMENLVTDLGYEGNSFNSYPFGGSTVIRTELGQPIGSFYGYVADGIFTDYDDIAQHANQGNQDPYVHDRNMEPSPHRYTAPGDIRFKDMNRDGVIDEKDRTFIGSPFPDFTYGLSLGAKYKNFEISAFIQGVAGAEIMNLNRYFTEGMVGGGNFAEDAMNRWTDENPDQDFPRAILTDPNSNTRISSRWIESGDYIRLSNLQLGYQLPTRISQRIQVQQMRIYVTGKNLYTHTSYSGYDPDVGSLGGNVLQSGIDLGRYPLSRTFLIGINLGL